MDVLRSGECLLGSAVVDLLIETHSADLEHECLEWLAGRGYNCEVIRNAPWRVLIPEARAIAHNRWLWATNTKENRGAFGL
jgi:hypothetical protein